MSTDTTRPAAAWQEPSPPDLHWTAITNALIDFDLTPRQFQVAVALLSYRWFKASPIIPSVRTLAERLRCSPRTIQYAIRGLVAKRLIVVQYCYRPDGGQMSNLFQIGPALEPLLAPVPGGDSVRSSDELRPPVQRLADKREEAKNTNRTNASQRQNGAVHESAARYLQGPLAAYIRT